MSTPVQAGPFTAPPHTPGPTSASQACIVAWGTYGKPGLGNSTGMSKVDQGSRKWTKVHESGPKYRRAQISRLTLGNCSSCRVTQGDVKCGPRFTKVGLGPLASYCKADQSAKAEGLALAITFIKIRPNKLFSRSQKLAIASVPCSQVMSVRQ